MSVEEMDVTEYACYLFASPWTVAPQAPLSVDFFRQEYWSELPFPSPGDLAIPGIEPRSPDRRQILYHLSHQGSPNYEDQIGKSRAFCNA